MVVGIASDHRGFKTKTKIIKYLDKKGIKYKDFGTDSTDSVDYNDFALMLCKDLNKKKIDCGILICGTGIGMSIMANKINGIMCAKVDSVKDARLAKEHNNANVISMSAELSMFEIKGIIDTYLNSKFINEEKYVRRIDKIKKMEKVD